uniref:Subtilisin-like protease n=1 Tax=Oryza brachyantha TaxID=4533 RepID=J3LBM2_ORYBR
MDSRSAFPSSSLLLVLVLVLPIFVNASSKLYIVYMGEKKHDDPSVVIASHHDALTSVFGRTSEIDFVTFFQWNKLPEVVTVKPNTYHEVHTTRSWDFLGLKLNHYEQSSLVKKAHYGEDVIVGVVGTGVWPESRSFDDNGYGPVPARWKGKCQTGARFNSTGCNRKIIGARCSIDRSFPTVVSLGNKENLVGQSINYNTTVNNSSFHQLVVADELRCDDESLASLNVTGKIVLCGMPVADTSSPIQACGAALGAAVKAQAKGLVFAQQSAVVFREMEYCNQLLPAGCVLVDFEIAARIASYASSARKPVVKISRAVTVVGNGVLAPRIASFSSRGPSFQLPSILKPDVAAPGVNILAAVGDSYEFMSGTSMACPHVSAVAALLKSIHPDWSPAMIKSAIVTTGTYLFITTSVTDRFGMPIQSEGVLRKVADPFDFGGGQIDPDKSVDPGLVYDIDPKEYNIFLNCTLSPKDDCESYTQQLYQLNLPSIAVPDLKDSITVWRTVTNVGGREATYKASIEAPAGVSMSVEPSVITFTRGSSRSATFKVTFKARQRVQGGYTFGSLTWLDGVTHSVRIPVAIRIVIEDFISDTS